MRIKLLASDFRDFAFSDPDFGKKLHAGSMALQSLRNWITSEGQDSKEPCNHEWSKWRRLGNMVDERQCRLCNEKESS